jgi:hypothetical protein
MYYVQIEILVEFLSRWRGKDKDIRNDRFSFVQQDQRERQGYIIVAKELHIQGSSRGSTTDMYVLEITKTTSSTAVARPTTLTIDPSIPHSNPDDQNMTPKTFSIAIDRFRVRRDIIDSFL